MFQRKWKIGEKVKKKIKFYEIFRNLFLNREIVMYLREHKRKIVNLFVEKVNWDYLLVKLGNIEKMDYDFVMNTSEIVI